MSDVSTKTTRVVRRRVLAVAAGIALVGAVGLVWLLLPTGGRADPNDAAQVALGHDLYQQHCASCHGTHLEGQPNWRDRQPNGRLPAPPHDATGHTWHHPDAQLFAITKQGLQAFAPAGYESDMPAFAGTLSDKQIWAVLAYIKSTWPREIRERQERMSRQAAQ